MYACTCTYMYVYTCIHVSRCGARRSKVGRRKILFYFPRIMSCLILPHPLRIHMHTCVQVRSAEIESWQAANDICWLAWYQEIWIYVYVYTYTYIYVYVYPNLLIPRLVSGDLDIRIYTHTMDIRVYLHTMQMTSASSLGNISEKSHVQFKVL